MSGFGLPGLTASNFGTTLAATGTLTVAWEEPNGSTTNLPPNATVFGVRLQFVGPAAATAPIYIDGLPTAIVAGDENLTSLPVTTVSSILSIDRTLIVSCSANKTVECGSVWQFDQPVPTDNCGGLGSVRNGLT